MIGYYNNQKEESYIISNAIINNDEIDENIEYADKLLSVSNNTLVYNLIKNSRLETVNEGKIIKGE